MPSRVDYPGKRGGEAGAVTSADTIDVVAGAGSTELNRVRPWVIAVAACGLLVATNGPSVYLALHVISDGLSWESPEYLVPFATVSVIGVVLFVSTMWGQNVRRLPWPVLPIAAYVAWSLVSTAWSVAAPETFIRALTAIGIVAFACWLGISLRWREQLLAVAVSFCFAAVASVAVVIVRREYGTMSDSDAWKGIFGNRNSLGPVCVLAIVALAGVAFEFHSRLIRLATVVFVGLSLVALVRSESDTALLALGGVLLSVGALAAMRYLARAGVSGTLVAVAAVALGVVGWAFFFGHLATFSGWFGRDSNLSSRRLIWADMRASISTRPWFGYGYWAFWDDPVSTRLTYERLGSAYGSAHNSVLEVALGLGVVGAFCFLVIVSAALANTMGEAWARPSVRSWWWAVVVVFVLVENLTESFVLWHSYSWILLLVAATNRYGRGLERG